MQLSFLVYLGLVNGAYQAPNVHIYFYGEGEGFEHAVERLRSQVLASGLIAKDRIYSFTSLPREIRNDPKWQWHLRQRQGAHYWFWKAALGSKLLRTRVPEGDLLLYLDAGTELGLTEESKEQFAALMETMESYDVTGFQNMKPERQYTKGDVFAKFGEPPSSWAGDTNQICATYLLVRSNARVRDLFSKWESLLADPSLVGDAHSSVANAKDFIHNRHDQSLWSLLLKANQPTIRSCNSPWFKSPHSPPPVRNRKMGVEGLRVQVFPDPGWPKTPCAIFAGARNHNFKSTVTGSCKNVGRHPSKCIKEALYPKGTSLMSRFGGKSNVSRFGGKSNVSKLERVTPAKLEAFTLRKL